MRHWGSENLSLSKITLSVGIYCIEGFLCRCIKLHLSCFIFEQSSLVSITIEFKGLTGSCGPRMELHYKYRSVLCHLITGISVNSTSIAMATDVLVSLSHAINTTEIPYGSAVFSELSSSYSRESHMKPEVGYVDGRRCCTQMTSLSNLKAYEHGFPMR